MASIVCVTMFYAAYPQWWGGHCFGPRFLLETMPLWAGLLWHAWPRITGRVPARVLTLIFALWSVTANGLGYLVGWSEWQVNPNIDACPDRLWDWRDNPLACAVLGLPDRVRYELPLQGRRYYRVAADSLNFNDRANWRYLGRGWALRRSHPAARALGRDAQLLFSFGRRPIGELILVLQSEPKLPGPQQVTVRVNGRVKVTAPLMAVPSRIVVPIVDTDLTHQVERIGLEFATSRRRSFEDIRRYAAALHRVEFAGLSGSMATPAGWWATGAHDTLCTAASCARGRALSQPLRILGQFGILLHGSHQLNGELPLAQQLTVAEELKAVPALFGKLTVLKPEMQIDNAERVWKLDLPFGAEQLVLLTGADASQLDRHDAAAIGEAEVDVQFVDYSRQVGGVNLIEDADQAFLSRLGVLDDRVANDHRQDFGRRVRHGVIPEDSARERTRERP
jgi:hypothetical protein